MSEKGSEYIQKIKLAKNRSANRLSVNRVYASKIRGVNLPTTKRVHTESYAALDEYSNSGKLGHKSCKAKRKDLTVSLSYYDV